MKTYAVLGLDNKVVNIINAGSKDLAESLTSAECIHVNAATGIAGIGFLYSNGVFTNEEATA